MQIPISTCIRFVALLWISITLAPGFSRAADTLLNRKIQPNDILSIRVVNEHDLTMDRRVGPDGSITYPFVETLIVQNKTTTEVERLLRSMLHPDYIIDPQISIDFKEYVKDTVTVTGEVNMPGPIELPTDRKLDLLEVLARARDFKPSANKDYIEVSRKGWEKPRIFKYSELRLVVDPEKKFYVQADDKVWVKERIL
jgi:protein involved in polysaccharide export with SLBB domain